MPYPDFIGIVRAAWENYDQSRIIKSIRDISANVSTNHVYKIDFDGHQPVIAKLSYFGFFEHFVEDHSIINSLANIASKILKAIDHLFVKIDLGEGRCREYLCTVVKTNALGCRYGVDPLHVGALNEDATVSGAGKIGEP